MDRIIKLKKELEKGVPEHDTPVGLIHPYWARKPMNIVSKIIECLAEPDDLILDPFMGSGTTIFSAISNKKSIIGTDINPLSVFLVKTLLDISKESEEILKSARDFVDEFESNVLPWYKLANDDTYIERERFQVNGNFENGNFSLNLAEIVTKKKVGNKWKGRKALTSFDRINYVDIPKRYMSHPINFESIELLANSRIAIPRGAKLSHFYSYRNMAAINFALNLINKSKAPLYAKDIYLLLLSSSLPLLRFSDKKASSQWPYWRPKKMLTSRNPVIVFEKRLQALDNVAKWWDDNNVDFKISNMKNITKSNRHNPTVCVECAAIQELKNIIPSDTKVDLIITDPPYSDQVPYLEYSALWIEILNLKLPVDAYMHEIVKTNAEKRIVDSASYLKRLSEALEICCNLVKINGLIVWFYQDHELKNWACINDVAKNNNVEVVEIIPIPKQRRSMKTVTTPGKTLDGDLICIFQKKATLDAKKEISFETIIDNLTNQINLINEQSFFDKYSRLIEYSLKENYISILSQRFKTVDDVLTFIIENSDNC
ncbi:DNA methyltransferase [Methanococcoides methylutens]|uniref:DNA methylase N-4/N-6 domain-containing protein n=1 Tax=Methanococcoides methylutens MM1 TaxID=1434104 RepID=A0A0E3WZV2_METMT|nr:DNA methyltransferase [Methanococcoides methylutens]AKB85364.1 hypothetical protein MCMEM_1311 [Methanococcoides methylutens MM1]